MIVLRSADTVVVMSTGIMIAAATLPDRVSVASPGAAADREPPVPVKLMAPTGTSCFPAQSTLTVVPGSMVTEAVTASRFEKSGVLRVTLIEAEEPLDGPAGVVLLVMVPA